MKNIALLLILAFVTVSSFNSCKKKYPENKYGSLKRPANRLCGGKVWELEKYYVNGVVDTYYDGQYYKQTYSELCVGGGDMKCNTGLLVVECLLFSPSLSFSWNLSTDESTFQSVEVGDPLTPTTPNKQILKLNKNDFWYKYTDQGGTMHEFHLKRKRTFGKN
jgi:hypothetical protein